MSKKLSEIVLHNRMERGLSLRGFAKICAISVSYLKNIEQGNDLQLGRPNSLTVDMLIKLAKGLKMPLRELMERAGYFEEDKSHAI